MCVVLAVEWSGFIKNLSHPVPMPFDRTAFHKHGFGPLDIYQDVSTVLYDMENVTIAYNGGHSTFTSQYVFQLDNVSRPHVGAIGNNDWDVVATEIGFGPLNPKGNAMIQPLFGYPFDEWQGRVSFVAIDPLWGKEILKINGTGVFQLAGATLTDNTR